MATVRFAEPRPKDFKSDNATPHSFSGSTALWAASRTALESHVDAVEQVVLSEGLGQIAYNPSLQRTHSDSVVGIGRDQDSGNGVTGRGEVIAKVQSAHAGHVDIRNQATCPALQIRTEKILGTREGLHREA